VSLRSTHPTGFARSTCVNPALFRSRPKGVGVHVISEAMETVTKTLRVEFQPIEFRPTCYQGSGLLKRSR
jgi:hypothetical protein